MALALSRCAVPRKALRRSTRGWPFPPGVCSNNVAMGHSGKLAQAQILSLGARLSSLLLVSLGIASSGCTSPTALQKAAMAGDAHTARTLPDAGANIDEVATFCTAVLQVSAGGLTTCALDDAGAVTCWGLNDNGQATVPVT